jgi:hypothetical protein
MLGLTLILGNSLMISINMKGAFPCLTSVVLNAAPVKRAFKRVFEKAFDRAFEKVFKRVSKKAFKNVSRKVSKRVKLSC